MICSLQNITAAIAIVRMVAITVVSDVMRCGSYAHAHAHAHAGLVGLGQTHSWVLMDHLALVYLATLQELLRRLNGAFRGHTVGLLRSATRRRLNSK